MRIEGPHVSVLSNTHYPKYNQYTMFTPGFAIYFLATILRPDHVRGVQWSHVQRKSRFLEPLTIDDSLSYNVNIYLRYMRAFEELYCTQKHYTFMLLVVTVFVP